MKVKDPLPWPLPRGAGEGKGFNEVARLNGAFDHNLGVWLSGQ